MPTGLNRIAWQRDSYFTDYPAGHVGEPSGTARAGTSLFRASKRGLHWLTLSDGAGAGLALLPADGPLVGRTDPAPVGTTLFASREVAGPHGLSGSWVEGPCDPRRQREVPLRLLHPPGHRCSRFGRIHAAEDGGKMTPKHLATWTAASTIGMAALLGGPTGAAPKARLDDTLPGRA